MSWGDWLAAAAGVYAGYEVGKSLDAGETFPRTLNVGSAEAVKAAMHAAKKKEALKKAAAERVIDESELPEEVRRHLSAEEQKEKLLEAIESENDVAKRAELIKQLKALK